MAPEIMQARGYTYSADIWSIGIILYQFIYGKLPFG
jgi:serine/threonine protein kinase